jgi:hypothetical protein
MRAVLQGIIAWPMLRVIGVRCRLVNMGTGGKPVRVIVLSAPIKRQEFMHKLLVKVRDAAKANGQTAGITRRRLDPLLKPDREDLRIDDRLAVRVDYR